MRDAKNITRSRGGDYMDYKKMSENPNPPLETRKKLYALEYAKKVKDSGKGNQCE